MERRQVQYTLEEFAKAEHWCWQAFQEYQKAEDDAEILRETGKDLLEAIKNSLEKEQFGKGKISDAALERMARASDKWREFREGQFESIRKAGVAKVKYFSAVRYFETVQSGLAYKRTELQRLGGV